MTIQDAFVRQLEAEIQGWARQAEALRARLERAAVPARADDESRLKSVEQMIREATQALARVQRANEAGWKEFEPRPIPTSWRRSRTVGRRRWRAFAGRPAALFDRAGPPAQA